MADGIAPWIQPADPAAQFIRAYQAGAQVAEARNRLAVMQMEEERRGIEDAQRMEIERAERRQRYDLQTQALAQKQQQIGMAAAVAGRRAAAQQEYRTRVGSGEDPMQVISELGPSLGSGWQSAMAAAERRKAAQMPETAAAGQVIDPATGQPIKGLRLVPSSTGYHTMAEPGFASQQAAELSSKRYATQNRIAKLKADRAEILKRYSGMFPPEAPKSAIRGAQWKRDKAALDAMSSEMEQLAPGVAAAATATQAAPALRVLPMPPSKKDAVVGQLYQTSKGPMEWDGEKFIRPRKSPPRTASEESEER